MAKRIYRKGKIIKYCKFCGKEFNVFYCLNRIKFCSMKCYHNSRKNKVPWNKGLTIKNDKRVLKYTKKKLGKKSHFWKGGKSFEPYPSEFNNYLKQQIKKRDNFTCQECGITEKESGWELAVHHIDFNKMNNNPNNLITLCRACHAQTNYNRKDWINYYQAKMNGKTYIF